MRTIIAIDPGMSGAIAVQDESGRVYTDSMPETIKDIWDYFASESAWGPLGAVCYLENVGYHVKGNNASASCKFARHCGALEMALVAAGIPQIPVTPQKWMKTVCGQLPKEKAERKRVIRDRMQRMYPNVKVTLQNADALGLLTYAMWQEKQG